EIMCRKRLDFGAISAEMEIDFERYFADEIDQLAPLEEDGLVRRGSNHLQITPTGRYFLRNIAMVFDVYLSGRRSAEGTSDTEYSKTV
ncbi:MAG: coproporphyrinogen III oxidase, partial [Persicimonas sp.]